LQLASLATTADSTGAPAFDAGQAEGRLPLNQWQNIQIFSEV